MSLPQEILEAYREAGTVAQQALQYGLTLIKPGASMREVLDKIETFIHEKGCEPAFPAQSCVNETAAHYCPTEQDDHIYESTDLVKLDVGVHKNGYIGDNATSISLDGKNDELILAVKDAVTAAEAILKPGTTPDDVGRVIQEAITKRGFQPIRNLTGHGLNQFIVHDRPSMPNYPSGDTTKLEEGMVVAIEPFATDGSEGLIYNSTGATIFSLKQEKPIRSPHARGTLEKIKEWNGLPFTTRWLTQELGGRSLLGLAELKRAGMLEEYPPLPEKTKGLVAQHEHTFLITKDGSERLTN